MKRATTILLSAVALTSAGCGGADDREQRTRVTPQATADREKPARVTPQATADREKPARVTPQATTDSGEPARDTPQATADRPSLDDNFRPAAPAHLDPVPDSTDLEAYRKRCKNFDLSGARARVLYEARKEMTRGDPDTVTAAVTLNQSAPPNKLLHREEAAEESGVVVSCRIQAQLSASPYEFEVDETDWVERSLLTNETARWSWFITPKIGGMQNLVLKLRPILKVMPTNRPTNLAEDLASAAESNVQQYETSVHVNVPWTERPQETMSRLAATFKVAEGLVKALTLLVVAVLSLGAVLGIRRRRKKRATSLTTSRATS